MKTSSYEAIVIFLLKKNKIIFKREQAFEDLKGKKYLLRFDFVVFDKKTNEISYILEVNGEQHYKPISIWGGLSGLKKRQGYDRKKIAYSLAKKIPLVCLPYWDINKSLTYEDIINNPEYLVKSIWHNHTTFKKREGSL